MSETSQPGTASARPATRSRRSSGGVRIERVAEVAGVSTATVSRVLTGAKPVSEPTRTRVLDAVARLGYRPSQPAAALAGQRTRTLGLLMTDLSQPFYAELAGAVERVARDRGYTMIIATGSGDAEREAGQLETLARHRVDGILVASWGITSRHRDWLAEAPVEVVLVSCRDDGVGRPAIVSASRRGACEATEHLLGLGHRRIGEIAGPAASTAAAERRAGRLDATAAFHDVAVVTASAGDVDSGRVAAERLLASQPRPTALLCYNDLVAAGAMQAARAAGLDVPGDVSVVGFDDVPLAALLHPGLTTVAQDVEELATWSVDRLVERVEGRAAARGADVSEVPCRLVVRGSTAPPAAPA